MGPLREIRSLIEDFMGALARTLALIAQVAKGRSNLERQAERSEAVAGTGVVSARREIYEKVTDKLDKTKHDLGKGLQTLHEAKSEAEAEAGLGKGGPATSSTSPAA